MTLTDACTKTSVSCMDLPFIIAGDTFIRLCGYTHTNVVWACTWSDTTQLSAKQRWNPNIHYFNFVATWRAFPRGGEEARLNEKSMIDVSGPYATSYGVKIMRQQCVCIGKMTLTTKYLEIVICWKSEKHKPPAGRNDFFSRLDCRYRCYAVVAQHFLWCILYDTLPACIIYQDEPQRQEA